MAKYELGGSGLQIESRSHRGQKMNHKSIKERAQRNTSSKQRNPQHPKFPPNHVKIESKSNTGVTNIQEQRLFAKPKSFITNLTKVIKLEKYGQLDSANDSNVCGNKATRIISVFNDNIATSDVKGKQFLEKLQNVLS